MANTIAFTKFEHVVLWRNELSGQISDGCWENASPFDHYKPWCRANAIVDAENPGRDFYARKDNYNFTAPILLEAVGRRMMYALALAQQQPEATAKALADGTRLPESDDDWNTYTNDDWKKRYIESWQRAGLTKLGAPAPQLKDLKNVLNEMKKIVRTQRKGV